MDIKILEVIASAPDTLTFHGDEHVTLFSSLIRQGLVIGTVHASTDSNPYAVICGLTPDGKALLSINRYRSARTAAPTASQFGSP
ncbi:hypothetical protein ABIE13_001036 [Ottowia thiooxydans]|uniref:Uncharacterized protein n=1 Tax=Ottowia thiooxydans TaxID=219182 RepID=A0ABV2Q4H0_9BURK